MTLTKTQSYIIQRIAEGHVVKQIAHDIDMSYKQLSKLIERAKKENNCTNRDQLVLKSYVAGIIAFHN